MVTESKLEDIKNALIKYKANPKKYSLTCLSKEFGVKRQTLSKYLLKEGYEIINYQNQTKIDETLFDNIDNEEKAYWLGFLFADGNISKDGYRITLALAIKDEEHLKKFKDFLKYKGSINYTNYNNNPGCRIFFRSKHMWESLNTLGCVPAKSLVLNFPNLKHFKSKELIRHFLRGYCDGDGFLGFYKNHKCELSFVGTESFLKSSESFFNIKGYIRNKTSKNWENKAFDLKYAGRKARMVARILYENSSVYLQRKYIIFQQFCQLEEESSRIKSSKLGRS